MSLPTKHPALYWFRNDLRLHDNEALSHALAKTDTILFVYIFEEASFKQTEFGFQKTGIHRVRFIIEAVEDLRKRIELKGGRLLIEFGKPEEILPRLCKQVHATAVYAHSCVTYDEIKCEERLESALWKIQVGLHMFEGNTLVHKEDLNYPIKSIPDVFTDFRKHAERYIPIRPSYPEPKSLKSPFLEDYGAVPTFEILGIKKEAEDFSGIQKFESGERAALKRLSYYLWDSDLIATYKETRNGLLGMDYSSKFSPYLALGCLSARFIYHETKRYERERKSNQSTYWLIFELLWRDYFHFLARKYGSSLFLEGGIKNQPNKTRRSEKLIRAWKDGKTGNPFVDANMRELKATGYMSNRGRQNVASYFVKDLNQDWRVGAAWFESMLLDYDPCSNYGNWNYIAGIGNDPRENRYFNTVKQAHNYDGKGVYTHHWLPELNLLQPPFLFQPELADKGHLEKLGIVLGKTYPFPVAEISQKTLFS